MSQKISAQVIASVVVLDDGRFSVKVDKTLEEGKRITAGMGACYSTHEEAVERATNQIKRFLMPVEYDNEPLDLDWELD